MKFKFKFDGDLDRKKLAGYFAVDDKGDKFNKATLWPIWVTRGDFPDGLPDGFDIEITPIFNGKKKPSAKVVKLPTKKKVAEKAADKPNE